MQVDNSWKDNKNRYVFAFAAHLVHLKIFMEVTIICLIQGHTHEDVDQMFSNWSEPKTLYRFLPNIYFSRSKLYSHWPLLSIPDIPAFVERAYSKDRPSVRNLTCVWDWKVSCLVHFHSSFSSDLL
jgi:hypothetical protein